MTSALEVCQKPSQKKQGRLLLAFAICGVIYLGEYVDMEYG